MCSYEVDARGAFMVCRECGRTSGARVVDEGAEWRRFEASDVSKVRVVARQTDRLAIEPDAAAGVLAAGGRAGAVDTAQRRGDTTRDAETRAMRTAFAKLGDLCATLRLSARVLDAAKDAVCELRAAWVRTRGRPRALPHDEAAMCVVLHAVCAADGCPLPYAELAARAQVPLKRIAAARRTIHAAHPALCRRAGDAGAGEGGNAPALVRRCGAPFALAPAEMRRAEVLAGELARGDFAGRPPAVAALAALYLVLKRQPAYALARQGDVADRLAAACFVSTKTARATVARIEESPALLARAASLWSRQVTPFPERTSPAPPCDTSSAPF